MYKRQDISNIKDVYQKLGLVMPMNVEKFLTVYGMLVFEDDERKENLEFIPEKALAVSYTHLIHSMKLNFVGKQYRLRRGMVTYNIQILNMMFLPENTYY